MSETEEAQRIPAEDYTVTVTAMVNGHEVGHSAKTIAGAMHFLHTLQYVYDIK
jgi:hypothetical protein